MLYYCHDHIIQPIQLSYSAVEQGEVSVCNKEDTEMKLSDVQISVFVLAPPRSKKSVNSQLGPQTNIRESDLARLILKLQAVPRIDYN